MLPANLFSARIRKGNVRPNYLPLESEGSISLAGKIIEIFEQSVGRKKALLFEDLEELESRGLADFKTVRGLATILDRRCTYIVDSKVEPMSTRAVVFEEASKRRIATVQEKHQLLSELSSKMNLNPDELEESLFRDLDEEQILSNFDAVNDPSLLVKSYNLSLAQTALFKSVSMEFNNASGNWKRIFRDIKRFGLMYSVEKLNSEGYYTVYLDGPMSLFKMTERYGTSLAKLLPTIVAGDSWSFKADLIDRKKNNRILHFEESKSTAPEFATLFSYEESQPLFDSSVEERFASKFNSFNTGWVLKREPEPLIAGKHVLIPDFSFEKYGYKIFMEIVGFWTKEYIERKLAKLASLSPDTEIIVALNENLRCSESKLAEVKAVMVLTYSKEVPIEPIVSHLKGLEAGVEEKQVEELRNRRDFLGFVVGETVNLVEAARDLNVPLEILKRALSESELRGYRMIGDYLLSESKIDRVRKSIDERLSSSQSTGALGLAEASNMVESFGIGPSPTEILSFLGYEIEWNGLDLETSKVRKKKQLA
jgi:predicted nuclease of restriction endonuclease-like RecB superfamily